MSAFFGVGGAVLLIVVLPAIVSAAILRYDKDHQ